MELQKLYVSLMLKSDQFKSGLDDARGRVEGFASSMGGRLQMAGKIATGALLGVGAAAVTGFGLAMKTAIDMNASLEQSTMQFTTLMGDADRAQEHVKALFEFGAKTPFETGPIIEASKHLQVFGGEALNTMDNLTLIGDASAAVGQPINEVSFWVGRMYAALQAGKPFGEAAARLQEMGIMGPQVRDQLEQMQASGASAQEIFSSFQGTLGSFSGAMEMQSKSWTGLTSTLKDGLAMAAANGLAPFFEMAKSGLGGLVDWLGGEQVQGAILGFSNAISTLGQYFSFVVSEGDPLNDFLADLPAGLQPIIFTLGQVVEVVRGFILNLQEGMSPIDAFIEAIWDIAPQPVLDALVNFRDNILPPLKAQFDAVVGPIIAWVQNNVQLKDALIVIAGVILATVVPAVVSLVVSLAGIIIPLMAVIGLVALVRTAWEENWGGIQEKTAAVINFIKTLVSGFVTAITGFWNNHGDSIKASTLATWGMVKELVTAVLGFIRNLVSGFVDAVTKFWKAHGDTIMAVARNMWDIVKAVFETAFRNLQTLLQAFTALFKGDWSTFKEKIFEIWDNLWKLVLKVVSELWDSMKLILDALWTSIKGWWDSIDWGELGRQIVDGIVWAIELTGTKIRDQLMAMARAAWDAVKEFFGIESPSKLMAWAGDMIVQGLIVGIQSQRKNVSTVLDDLVHDVEGKLSFAGAFGNIASGMARRYQQTTLDPLAKSIKALDDYIGGLGLQDMFKKYGISGNQPMKEQLAQLKWWGQMSKNGFEVNTANLALQKLNERNRLEADYVEKQEKLYELEKARADLDFLKSQLDLLKLVADNRNILPKGILDGLKLGLEADSGQIMNTMVDIMKRLVNSASDELGIHSPSKKGQYLTEMFMAGMERGLRDISPLESALDSALKPLTAAASNKALMGNNSVTTVNGGYNVHIYGKDESALKQLSVLAR